MVLIGVTSAERSGETTVSGHIGLTRPTIHRTEHIILKRPYVRGYSESFICFVVNICSADWCLLSSLKNKLVQIMLDVSEVHIDGFNLAESFQALDRILSSMAGILVASKRNVNHRVVVFKLIMYRNKLFLTHRYSRRQFQLPTWRQLGELFSQS